MGLLGKRKNKKFNYKPRYFEHDGEGSPFSIEHKFDKYRSTVGENQSLKGKFKTAWGELRETSDKNTRLRLLVLIGVLLFVFLLIIGFDLSIFYQ
jgi:hypothetical protein